MLTYDLSQRNDQPLYEYLYRCISQDIQAGVLPARYKLPSKRALAKHLGVAVITIEGCYAQLMAEGYVRAVERKGYYVNDLGVDELRKPLALGQVPDFPRKGIDGEDAPDGEDVFRCARDEGPLPQAADASSLLADFCGTTVSLGQFPYNSWAHHVRAVLATESEQSLLGQSGSQGSMRLRRALCSYLAQSRGMDVSPDQIVVGAGAQYLYGVVMQLLDRKVQVAVEDPGYPRLAKIYGSQGIPVHHVPLDAEGINMEALAKTRANVVHVMPSHQFPTGLVTSATRRYQLLGWAAQDENRLILEDDYDCEYRFAGRPIPPLQKSDGLGQVVYVNTFSKSLGAGFRIGYLVLPPQLAQKYRDKLGFYSCTVSAIEQLSLARFIEAGDYERHVARTRTHYRKLRDALIAQLKKADLAGLEIRQQDAGLHFMMGVLSSDSADSIAHRALERGVRLLPLERMAHRLSLSPSAYALAGFDPKKAWFVMNYPGVDEHALTEIVHIIAQSVRG